MKLSEAQSLLLNLIREVENGEITPDQAVGRFDVLKQDCSELKADYVLSDFQRIYKEALSVYESSSDYIEPSYESSESY